MLQLSASIFSRKKTYILLFFLNAFQLLTAAENQKYKNFLATNFGAAAVQEYDSLIQSLFPVPNSVNADDSSIIKIQFYPGKEINEIYASDFLIYGSINGNYDFGLIYNNTANFAEISPSKSFFAGEKITVISRTNLITVENDTIKPFSWSFIAGTERGSASFSFAGSFPVEELWNNPLVADINKDGLPDLIYLSHSNGHIIILKNSSNLNFSYTLLQANMIPNCMSIGDYNNDGYQDIAVGNDIPGSPITIFTQNPDGSFFESSLSVSSTPYVLKNADIDNDGNLDLVFYSFSPSNGIYIYRNTGEGSFQYLLQIPFSNSGKDFELSDLDNDGDLDIALALNFNRKILILEQLPGIQFRQLPEIIVSGEPIKIICKNFTNDAYTDIALLNEYNNSITFLKNSGNLNFSPAGAINYIGSPASFDCADFDNDDDLDIAATTNGNYLTLLTNRGDFNFTRTTENLTENYISKIAASDLDLDGDIDLALNGCLIYLNRNAEPDIKLLSNSYNFKSVNPGIAKTITFKIFNNGAAQDLEISEIISSGSCFIVSPASATVPPVDTLDVTIQFIPSASEFYEDSITIYSNDADSPVAKFYVSGRGSQVLSVYPPPNSTKAADTSIVKIKLGIELNTLSITDSSIQVIGSYSGFHKSSLIDYSTADSSLTIIPENPFLKCERVTVSLTDKLEATGEQIFIPYTWDFVIQPKNSSFKFRLKKSIAVPSGTTMVNGKDVDNDGKVDLIVLSSNENKLNIYRNNGNWNFNLSLELNGGMGPKAFRSGDYDGDNDIDFVVTNISSRLVFFRNNGNLNFTRIFLNNVPGYLEMITQGDYDGDGDIDFYTANSTSDAIHNIVENNGNFNFTVYDSIGEGYIRGLLSADLDNDGDIDIVLSNKILSNEGDFNFFTNNIFYTDYMRLAFDPDQDGDLDLLHHTGIFRNDGDYLFTPDYSISASTTVSANDLDGDGFEDLCSVHTNRFEIYKNMREMKFNFISQYAVPEIVYDVKGLDLDSDNDNDLVFVSLNSNVLSIYENRDHFSEISLSSQQINFGTVKKDSSKSSSFFIMNPGTLPLTVDTMISSDNAFTVTPRSGVISPNDSLKITLTFTPDQIKTYADSIIIFSSDVENPAASFYVTGKARQKIIASVYPVQNAVVQNGDTVLAVFSESILQSSLNDAAVKVYGSKTGFNSCSIQYNQASKTLQLFPGKKFIAGETVTVIITNKIELADLTPVLNSYIWNFTIGVKEGSARFKKMNNFQNGIFAEYLLSADLDNDGLSDLAATNTQTDTVYLYKSEYGKGILFHSKIGSILYPGEIISDDFNSDGKIDIAINCYNSIVILRNNNNFNFIKYPVAFKSDSRCITSGDYDGDGDIDLAGLSYNDGNEYLRLILNEGNFSFQEDSLIEVNGIGSKIVSADFDNDGDIDILCGAEPHSRITIARNEGDLNFNKAYLPELYSYNLSIVKADFNSDGKMDIAVQDEYANSASILVNEEDLVFNKVSQPGIIRYPIWLSEGDFDADGDFDLAVLDGGFSNTGTIYLNNSLIFTEACQFTKESAYNILSSDLNGDGSLDLAYSQGWLMNTGVKNYTLSSYHLKFSDTKVGSTANLNITIYNVGRESILIDSIYSVSHNFLCSNAEFSIAPSDSEIITIGFQPDSVFHYIDTLTIYSNTTSYNKILLEGNAIPTTGIEKDKILPTEYLLYQNYPNPFNPVTEIQYAIPFRSNIKIIVYNLLGEAVKELERNDVSAGYDKIIFHAEDLSSGIYIYSFIANSLDGKHEYKNSKKMILLK
ncbi:MAG: FG-GAP-like repeat-containing protein [Ignavibacteria bacterium]